MPEPRATTTDAEQALVDEIGRLYGGAVSVAHIHGWRFVGALDDKGRSVDLMQAIRAYGEQQRAAGRRDMDRAWVIDWLMAKRDDLQMQIDEFVAEAQESSDDH